MVNKKRWGIFLLFVAVVLAVFSGIFLWNSGARAASVQAAETGNIWETGQTSNLLPALSESSNISGLGFTFSHNHTYEMHKTERGTWGIRPKNEYDDFGDGTDYTGGMYYTYTLSDADQVKADAKQLTLTTSAWYYIAGWSQKTYISLNVTFVDVNGSALGAEIQEKYNDSKAGANYGTKSLTLSSIAVPANTAKITFRWSSVTNGGARPWIAEMEAYLHDTTAPSFTQATMDDSGVIEPESNIAIGGDTVKYRMQFNEKVSVAESGTATLALKGGTFATSSSTETVDVDGKTSVVYTFTLPGSRTSGTLSLSSVSGLKVTDEAGNQFTYNGSPSAETLTFYGSMSVTITREHLAYDGEGTAYYGTDYTVTLVAETGYRLPTFVTVTVGDRELSDSAFTYDVQTGEITIDGKKITGDIRIEAYGVPKQYTVTLEAEGGTSGTGSVQATYNAAMPEITPPVRTGYRFGGYFTAQNGGGEQYYSDEGVGIGTYTFDGDLTLYAKWTANEYTVTYHANKPSGASADIAGNTGDSIHTYDAFKNLTANGFSLTGWTFQGWATEAGGEKLYDDGASVRNLSAEANGTVTLYAVWSANEYTVNYHANKPAGASAEVSGNTAPSSHTYDTANALSENGFSLTGWIFKGWNTRQNGEGTPFSNGQSVSTLVSEHGGEITLYAVWEANRYTVEYNSNKPTEASGMLEGETTDSSHVYDTESSLTANGFTLTGWTFQGWATSANGAVTYQDGAEVLNLTSANGGRVILYAVWTANRYTVEYDPNKPAAASGEIVEEMEHSSHTYDEEKALTANAYTLTGWTFKGWNTQQNGEGTPFSNGQSVSTLVSEDGGQITLYAVWEANDYTITLNAAGGSNSGSVDVTFDSILTDIPAIPARHGYNFCGYFDAQTGGTPYYGADGKASDGKTLTVADNIVLYAQWTPVTYTIELYSDGSYIDVLEDIVFGNLILPSAQELKLARSNFDFVGWNMYDEQNWAMYLADTSYSVGLTGEQDGVVVLYAAWAEKPVYTISFNADGGTGAPAMAQAHEDETICLDAAVPTRPDHTFLGWATSAGAQVPEFSAGGEFTMGSSVVTLYAVWKHNPALSYHANGGEFSGNIEPSYPASGSAVTVITISPVREGYTFLGWATDQAAEEAEYSGGGEFDMPDADTVLYAVWQKEKYAVTIHADGFAISGLAKSYDYGAVAEFTVTGEAGRINVYANGELLTPQDGTYTVEITGDLAIVVTDGSELSLIYSANGGTGAPVDTQTYSPKATAVISSEEPVREGYTFLGWAANASASEAEYQAGGSITFTADNIVLYAVWKSNNYSVEYNGNGGTGTMEKSTFEYGTAYRLSKNEFERTGATFAGWAISEKGDAVYGDEAQVLNLTAQNGGSVVLYAVWERTVTEIVFDADGGSGGSGQTSVVYGEELFSDGLEIPMRAGYTFGGYFTDQNGGGKMVFDEAMNVAEGYGGAWSLNEPRLTLYARWVPVSYFVVYMNGQTRLAEQAVRYGVSFGLKTAAELGVTAEEGYHFAGWATMPNSAGIAYPDGQSIEVGLSQTEGAFVYLYAVFAEDAKAEIAYDANGGTNAPVDGTLYYVGKDVKLSTVIPDREGYIFQGWSYDPNGESVAFPYTDGAFTPDTVVMTEDGITLYAVWKAGETLQSQIDAAREALSDAVSDLQKTIAANETDIEQKVAALDAAYKVADALIRSDFAASDTALQERIGALQAAMSEAETQLKDAIDTVENELHSEVARLEQLIGYGTGDVSEFDKAIADLDAAYQAADALINSEIADLKRQDEAIRTSIAALESAYKAADAVLLSGLEQVQAALEGVDQDLAEKDRTGNIYMIVNIALGCVAAGLVVMLVIRMVKNRKKGE